jgi:hypothetical protein
LHLFAPIVGEATAIGRDRIEHFAACGDTRAVLAGNAGVPLGVAATSRPSGSQSIESFYWTPRTLVAEPVRSMLALESVINVDAAVLLRAVELYEVDRLDFDEACLWGVPKALESTGWLRSIALSTVSGRRTCRGRTIGERRRC